MWENCIVSLMKGEGEDIAIKMRNRNRPTSFSFSLAARNVVAVRNNLFGISVRCNMRSREGPEIGNSRELREREREEKASLYWPTKLIQGNSGVLGIGFGSASKF